MSISVIKRNGNKEPLDIGKWQAQIAKVCEGIDGVSSSMIEIAAQAHFYDGIPTRELDQMALRAMIDLIDEEENPDTGHVNYQYAAGKQRISMLRKDVYGQYQPPRLYDIVKKNVELGFYTPDLLTWYSESEWDQIDKFVDHDKDELLPYAAVDQLIEKYLVQDRSKKGSVVETPQVRYAVAAATAFHAETENRMRWVKDFYNGASDGLFTLATPVLAGLGTKTKQFSSCVLIKSNDSLKSIFATGQVMADYAARRAGIGLEVGQLRPLGAPIRKGEVMHTGLIPFIKKWFADLRSCCVTPETWVEVLETHHDQTVHKTKKIQIKELVPGAKIKTMDESGQVVFKTVTDRWNTTVPAQDQVKLEFENGATLDCSVNHPIMIRNDAGEIQQKLPGQLGTQDVIITDLGESKISAVHHGQNNPWGYIDITVEGTHTFFAAAAGSSPMVLTHNSQGGIRNSSATLTVPIWHYQFDDFVVLKNNQGTEETRVRQLDYCVAMNKFFWRRFRDQGQITFFDPNQVPDLYEAFYRDTQEFEQLYVKYEQDPQLRKKQEPAETVIKDWLIKERGETGRYYLLNIDNVQAQGPLDTKIHPVYQTNLCVEILQHTRPFESIEDAGDFKFTLEDGREIALPGNHLVTMANGTKKRVVDLVEQDDVADFLI